MTAPALAQTLFALAYKQELAAAHRLARALNQPLETALLSLLQKKAGNKGLPGLIAERQHAQAQTAHALQLKAQQKRERPSHQKPVAEPDPALWQGWFDGACHPNPGRISVGARLLSPNKTSFELSHCAHLGDSNEAEYLALIALLEAAVQHQAHLLRVFGDSQVVITDIQQTPGQNIAYLRPYFERAHALLAQLSEVQFIWIPRHKNQQADALSQRAAQHHPMRCAE